MALPGEGEGCGSFPKPPPCLHSGFSEEGRVNITGLAVVKGWRWAPHLTHIAVGMPGLPGLAPDQWGPTQALQQPYLGPVFPKPWSKLLRATREPCF